MIMGVIKVGGCGTPSILLRVSIFLLTFFTHPFDFYSEGLSGVSGSPVLRPFGTKTFEPSQNYCQGVGFLAEFGRFVNKFDGDSPGTRRITHLR